MVLHFGGVDCFADYYLNGEKIGESDNMFIAHDFDVTKKLRYGEENTLHVHPGPKTLPWQRLFKDHLLLPSPAHQQKSLACSRRSRGVCGWLDAAIMGVR